MYRVFGKFCPIPLFAWVFIDYSVECNRDERESFSLRRYCTSEQYNAYIVTLMWFVYYISRESSENVLILRSGQYFPNTRYYRDSKNGNLYFLAPAQRN